jgi:hypothetical protein
VPELFTLGGGKASSGSVAQLSVVSVLVHCASSRTERAAPTWPAQEGQAEGAVLGQMLYHLGKEG